MPALSSTRTATVGHQNKVGRDLLEAPFVNHRRFTSGLRPQRRKRFRSRPQSSRTPDLNEVAVQHPVNRVRILPSVVGKQSQLRILDDPKRSPGSQRPAGLYPRPSASILQVILGSARAPTRGVRHAAAPADHHTIDRMSSIAATTSLTHASSPSSHSSNSLIIARTARWPLRSVTGRRATGVAGIVLLKLRAMPSPPESGADQDGDYPDQA